MALPFPILTAEEAAELIQDGHNIGFSGFTAAGAAKAVPYALAQKARRERIDTAKAKINELSVDSLLAKLSPEQVAALIEKLSTK